jgi:hypothetical protein
VERSAQLGYSFSNYFFSTKRIFFAG